MSAHALIDLSKLPKISEAALLATYEAAKTALTACSRLDECQDWADKAAAMASYAKQAEVKTLENLAMRIWARAIKRVGELFREIEAQSGKRTDIKPSGGAPTRLEVAKEAGISRDQMVTALRVANVPDESFEAQVESETPPTITALAEQGKAPRESNEEAEARREAHQRTREEAELITQCPVAEPALTPAPRPLVDLKRRDPAEFQKATTAQGHLRRFAEFALATDPAVVAPGMTSFIAELLKRSSLDNTGCARMVADRAGAPAWVRSSAGGPGALHGQRR